jgi:hypothetical protein
MFDKAKRIGALALLFTAAAVLAACGAAAQACGGKTQTSGEKLASDGGDKDAGGQPDGDAADVIVPVNDVSLDRVPAE